jgi:hypothetical protein
MTTTHHASASCAARQPAFVRPPTHMLLKPSHSLALLDENMCTWWAVVACNHALPRVCIGQAMQTSCSETTVTRALMSTNAHARSSSHSLALLDENMCT